MCSPGIHHLLSPKSSGVLGQSTKISLWSNKRDVRNTSEKTRMNWFWDIERVMNETMEGNLTSEKFGRRMASTEFIKSDCTGLERIRILDATSRRPEKMRVDIVGQLSQTFSPFERWMCTMIYITLCEEEGEISLDEIQSNKKTLTLQSKIRHTTHHASGPKHWRWMRIFSLIMSYVSSS